MFGKEGHFKKGNDNMNIALSSFQCYQHKFLCSRCILLLLLHQNRILAVSTDWVTYCQHPSNYCHIYIVCFMLQLLGTKQRNKFNDQIRLRGVWIINNNITVLLVILPAISHNCSLMVVELSQLRTFRAKSTPIWNAKLRIAFKCWLGKGNDAYVIIQWLNTFYCCLLDLVWVKNILFVHW